MYKQFLLLFANCIPLSIRQLCKLCPIWPSVLPQILAYALPVLFAVFPSLMYHFPLLKSFQRIHLCPNCAVILCNILVFCHPTPNIEINLVLAVRHCLLIIFTATLHIWTLSPPSATWCTVSCCQGVIILDGFQKLHQNSVGNLETMLGFLMLHVRWSIMWNVTQHQLGEPSTRDCDRFFWTACFFFCALKSKPAGLSQS
jgi:hypothetical protein